MCLLRLRGNGRTELTSTSSIASFGTARNCNGNSFTQLRGIADGAEHNFRFGVIRNHVGCAAATDRANIQRAAAEQHVFRQWYLSNIVKNIQQRMDGRMA